MSMYWKKRRLYDSDVWFAKIFVNGDTHRLELVTDGEHRYNPGNRNNFRNVELESEGFDRRLAINFGFFGGGSGGNDAVGYERSHKTIYHNWKTKGIYEMSLSQSNKMNLSDIWPDEIEATYPDAQFVISGGFTLIINGEIDIRGTEHFSHYNQKNPRTWVADFGDGWLGLYVAEGRSVNDSGLTAQQMAQICYDDNAITATSGDGGGSSIGLDEESNVVNTPSDGSPRSLPNMLVYYIHKDHINDDIDPIVPIEPTEGEQYAVLAMEYIRVSQARHGKGHSIDLAGQNTGIDIMHAPFDLEVKRVYDYDNTVWAESLEKVHFADGTYGYATIQLTHANTLAFKVGKQFKQGDLFYPEGMRNASGNHIHADIAKGKYIEGGWENVEPIPVSERIPGKSYTNMVKGWRLKNSVDPVLAWVVNVDFSSILDDKDLDFVTVKSWTKGENIYEGTEEDYTKIQYHNDVNRLRCRVNADPDSDISGYLKQGDIYNIDSIRIKLEGEEAWTTYNEEWGELVFPYEDVVSEITLLREQLEECKQTIANQDEEIKNHIATNDYLVDKYDDLEKELDEANDKIQELEDELLQEDVSEPVEVPDPPTIGFFKKLWDLITKE